MTIAGAGKADDWRRHWNSFRSGARTGDAGARTTNYSVGHLAKLEDAGLPGIGKVKTKAEAKQIYRGFVIENHPDKMQMGKSAKEQEERLEKLKKVNALWDKFKHSDEFSKLAAAIRATIIRLQ